MGDYKLIDLTNAKFTDLSEDAMSKMKASGRWENISRYDVVIDSVMEFMPAGRDVIPIPYIFRVYKYSGCTDDIEFGYKYHGKTAIKRGSLEEIEAEMIDAVLGVYLYSIGGIEWEPVK
jgi:hypothetical protein